jgi:hypothetical protein
MGYVGKQEMNLTEYVLSDDEARALEAAVRNHPGAVALLGHLDSLAIVEISVKYRS